MNHEKISLAKELERENETISFWIPPAFAGQAAGVKPGAYRAGMTLMVF